jgi:VWFA-related protein
VSVPSGMILSPRAFSHYEGNSMPGPPSRPRPTPAFSRRRSHGLTRPLLAVAIGVLLGATLPRSAAAGEVDSPPIFPAASGRVLVDFVVRDEAGNLIRDLRPEEVEVYEDGVRQTIESFALVADEPGAEAKEPLFLALAFDRLTPAARGLARRAASRVLDGTSAKRRWIGVFSLDKGLAVVQPFTADRSSTHRAVAGLSSVEAASEAGLRERRLVDSAYHGLGEGAGQGHVAPAEAAGSPECRLPEDVLTRLDKQVDARRTEAFHEIERGREDASTLEGLRALVEGLGRLPGRKAVVLFSQGLAVSGADPLGGLLPVVAAAQRARVSIYAADAGGLRVASAADEMRRTLDDIEA